jgi:hypothetical protein
MYGRIVDKLVSSVSQTTHQDKVRPLKSYRVIIPNTDKLCILMPPWHIWDSLWSQVQKRLIKQGFSLLIYEASEDILSPDGKVVANQFREVKDAALRDVRELLATGQFNSVDVVGLSLGTGSALYLAISGIVINKLVLLCPSADMAEGIYTGIRTKKIRRTLEKDGKTYEDYRKEMHELTMRKPYGVNIKEVDILLSEVDDVIPYRLGMELVESFRNRGLTVNVTNYRSRGHYVSFILFCLFGYKNRKSTS